MAAKKKTKKPAAGKKASGKPAKKTPAAGKRASGKTASAKASGKAAKKMAAKPAMRSAKPAPKQTPAPKQSHSQSRPPVAGDWDSTITPLEDRLIVQPDAPATVTAGGIIIPGTVNDRPVRGKVLAKGRGRRNKKGQLRPLDVSVGDDVMYSEWAGTKIEVGGQEVLILREEDVLGIVT